MAVHNFFGFCVNRGFISCYFLLLLKFIHRLIFLFYSLVFFLHWLYASVSLVYSSRLSLNILFRLALKKRGGCPLKIFTLFVYSVFSFGLKNPIFDRFLFLDTITSCTSSHQMMSFILYKISEFPNVVSYLSNKMSLGRLRNENLQLQLL